MRRSTVFSPLQLALALVGLVALGAGIGLMVAQRASSIPAAPPTAAAPETPTPAGQAEPPPMLATAGPAPTPSGSTRVPIAAGMPLPAAVAGDAAFGVFELGGAVDGTLSHPEHMKSAGMTWVSYDIAWEPGMSASSVHPLIEQSHRYGMRVLLSVRVAQRRAPGSDAVALVDFLRRVAYYGPDAVEVWPGANSAETSPGGDFSGHTYTRQVLAPAFNAVKQVNRNIMVLSGAPDPRIGYDGGCSAEAGGCHDAAFLTQMADAGAANYADCTGAEALDADRAAPEALDAQADLYAAALGRPVCFARYGIFSPEGFGPPPESAGWAEQISTAEQAEWLEDAVRRAAGGNHIRLMVVWNVDYLGWAGQSPNAGYAILRPDGTCPACATLGEVMRQQRGQK